MCRNLSTQKSSPSFPGWARATSCSTHSRATSVCCQSSCIRLLWRDKTSTNWIWPWRWIADCQQISGLRRCESALGHQSRSWECSFIRSSRSAQEDSRWIVGRTWPTCQPWWVTLHHGVSRLPLWCLRRRPSSKNWTKQTLMFPNGEWSGSSKTLEEAKTDSWSCLWHTRKACK